MKDLTVLDDLPWILCSSQRSAVGALYRKSRRMLVSGRLIVSISASIVLLASVCLDHLPGEIGSLGLHAVGHLTLEEPMVTLIVFLGFEIFRLDRTMTDLKTGVTSITSIA